MSEAEPSEPELGAPAPTAQPYRRPLRKRVMHVVRRAHLYFGLFLLPWAVLYGATGFLFNHPTAFADTPTRSFGAGELVGTPMEAPPRPEAVAAEVVTALNARAHGAATYTLVEPEQARYTRDFAFANTKIDGREVSILFDVNHPGGTVRSRPAPAPRVEEQAPFAIGPGAKGGPKSPRKTESKTHTHQPGTLSLSDSLHERVRDAAPVVLERTGFPTGEVTVTSVPDLSFLMSDGAKTWRVTYNALSGTISGSPAESAEPPEEMSTRRFLTHLHLAHGYPGSQNARWFWAVVVDAMAFVMVFWGISGLFMWWQLKATRKLGFVILLLSAAAATALGMGMHELLAPK